MGYFKSELNIHREEIYRSGYAYREPDNIEMAGMMGYVTSVVNKHNEEYGLGEVTFDEVDCYSVYSNCFLVLNSGEGYTVDYDYENDKYVVLRDVFLLENRCGVFGEIQIQDVYGNYDEETERFLVRLATC